MNKGKTRGSAARIQRETLTLLALLRMILRESVGQADALKHKPRS
jgi:hypothetical protein